MKIKSIAGTNIKGRNFALDLEAVNLVYGKNFSGKTTIIDALKLAVFGYHPDLGNKPGLTMQLATEGAKDMGVAVEMDDGSMVGRQWKRKGIKCSAEPMEGRPLVIPALMLDIGELFRMTGPARMGYIFTQCDIGSGFVVEALQALGKIEAKFKEQKAERAAVEEMLTATRYGSAASPQAILQDYIERVDERAKDADREVKRLAAGIDAHEAPDEVVDPVAVKEEMDSITVLIETAIKEEAGLKAKWLESDRLNQARAGIPDILAGPVDGEDVLEDLQAAIAALVVRIGVSSTQHESTEGEARTIMAQIGARRQSIEGELEVAKRKAGEIGKAGHGEACPHCGDEGNGYFDRMDAKRHDRLMEARNEVEVLTNAFAAIGDEAAQWALVPGYHTKVKQIERIEAEIKRRDDLERELEKMDVCPVDPAELKAKTDEVLELMEQRAAIDGRYRQAITQHEQEVRLEKDAEAKDRKELVRDIAKLAKKSLQASLNDAANKAVGKVLGIANEITAGILAHPLRIVDGEIGMDAGAGSHRTFSGTEQALAYMAVAVALASTAPIKLAVVDELGRLDPDNAIRFLERMVVLVAAGTIDQFIGIIASGEELDDQLPGVNYISATEEMMQEAK